MIIQIIAKLYLNYVLEEMECYQQGGCVEDDNIYVTLTYIYKYLVLGIYIFFTWKVVNNYKKSATTPRDQMRHQWVKQITQGVTYLFFGILLLQIGRYVYPILFWEKCYLGIPWLPCLSLFSYTLGTVMPICL